MAKAEHLKLLAQRIGVKGWNEWRKEHPEIKPDLRFAKRGPMDLSGIDLRLADLRWAQFLGTQFIGADFSEANLAGANLWDTNLSRACFRKANLTNLNLSHADLSSTDFSEAEIDSVLFASNDLSTVKGIETVIHTWPSTIGIDTFYKSNGNIPESFLRGCGLSDWQIENVKLFQPELSNEEITSIIYRMHNLRAQQPIQINPLFISYSHDDISFVDKIEKYLNDKGVRFWRDIHHSIAGKLETQVERAIRLNPTVLLILSSNSVESDWVQHEARVARKLELETKRDVLCPVALDNSWKDCQWPERLREQIMEYNILDFSAWNDEDNFRRMFTRLLEGLNLFYK